MKKYVVIGSSAAGVNGIRELRKYDKEAEIVLISKDKDIYSRCILHEYLAGKRNLERLRFVEKDFESLYKVNWKKGVDIGLRRFPVELLVKEPAGKIAEDDLRAQLEETGGTVDPDETGSEDNEGFARLRGFL